jgi:hypothetical protein
MLTDLYRCRFVLFLLIVFSSFKLNAQVENLGFLITGESTFSHKLTVGNEEVVIIKKDWEYFFYKIDYQAGTYITLDSTDSYSWNAPTIADSLGFYYVSAQYAANGNDVNYYLNYQGLNGMKHTSSIISTNVLPKPLHVMDDRLVYVIDSNNGQDILKTTDSFLVTHTTILSPAAPYSTSFLLGDTLQIVTKGESIFQLYTYTIANGAQIGITFPAYGNYDQVYVVGQKNNEYFLQFDYQGLYGALWKTDFTAAGSSIFIDSIQRIQSIEFEGEEFLLSEFPYQYDFSKGTYSDPESRIPVPFETELQSVETSVDLRLGSSFVRVLSHENGIELGHIENDTIKLLKDLAIGSRSGWIGEENTWGNFYQVPYFTELVGTDSLFTVMSNGNDSQTYLYSIVGDQFTSYFPLDNPEEVVSVKKSGDYFYWLRNNEGGIQLERRSLIVNLEPQTSVEQEDSALTWSRQLGYPIKSVNFWDYPYEYDLSHGCKFTQDGGAIVNFMVRNFFNNRIVSSEGYFSDDSKGAIIFCKYDQYGVVQWTKSFGDNYTLFLTAPVFELDSDGNVLVSGSFFQDGYFDNDTLQAERAAYFLLKLDGETGEILWKKLISETYYSDDLTLQGIDVNENNEIYLAFFRRQFSCAIDGVTLNTDLKPGHVVAKFSPTGTIEFLKDCPSPWATEIGRLRIFEYSEERDKLVMGQSHGYYNWSSSCQYSDWGYGNQVLDPEGNLEQSSTYTSDDLGSCTTGALTPENELIECGFFRSTLETDLFNETTAPTASCFENEAFIAVYSLEYNRIVSLKTSLNSSFFPLDSKYFGSHFYVYGTDEDDQLTVIKFDNKGNEIGYRQLGQYADPFDFEDDQFFDVNDDYLVFLGNLFKPDSLYGIESVFQFCRYKSILKIANTDWKTDKLWFEDESPQYFEDYADNDLVVFPNPFTSSVSVMFNDPESVYTSFELYDINGKLIQSGQLSGASYQELTLEADVQGAYFMNFISATERRVVKLIKM